jgi:hypothetical protein
MGNKYKGKVNPQQTTTTHEDNSKPPKTVPEKTNTVETKTVNLKIFIIGIFFLVHIQIRIKF